MEATVEVKFQEYQTGLASVLLVNHTDSSPVQYVQTGEKDEPKTLEPGDYQLYTWENPMGKRELTWSSGEAKNKKDTLVKDNIGEFFYDSKNDVHVYWVSFLDGMQRVLLFTEDVALATVAQQAGELEQSDQEITLSLQGMGLSLVNNTVQKEIAYMSIISSGVVWETKKKKRYKALKMKQSTALEAAYQKYQQEILTGGKANPIVKIGKMEVDFGNTPAMMIKPNKTEIRRRYEDGIWALYRSAPHQLQLHAKVHRLQLDNQLPGAVFPTVLAPVPPPKSIAAESVPKPFTELSVSIRKRDYTKIMQFKYCKILIQEMSVKVDQGFLNALVSLFASEALSEEAEYDLFKKDCEYIKTPLVDETSKTETAEQKNFYDELHFSPLKIHLSFSMYAGGEGADKNAAPIGSNVVNLFLQSVGVVISDIQDVIFKLGYFERNYGFYNQTQLTGEIVRHYSQQAIKQMYVLVLGLDVLGNPFGVIRGLATGIEDLFYEPYQGAIQGPQEFAEGLALGVRSLFGHTVGGAAGAVSRITGALGKGIATLTLDDEYQRKRREQLSKRPTDLKEGLARGGKGLVMGVVDGVTGIVTKPVEGAKQQGVEGFFKGMGKGLVGAFTRPASGVVDFASTSFDGLKRAAENIDEARRVRPPRFLHKDGVLRPYIHVEAEGNDILQDLEKGRYASSDQYVAHIVLAKDCKGVLLVTNKRVAFCSKGEIFGHWDCDWQYPYTELKEAPTYTTKGIQILLKEKKKKSFFSSGTLGKLVALPDKKSGEWIVQKMKEAMSKME